ncbi:MAG: Beta-ketoacyl synthase [Rhodocyclales bacterium]|nr:Beta-ketoacyl synthase [Rhodocyclales bacterium]
MNEAGNDDQNRNADQNIYIAGRGLACALGNTLRESVAHLATGDVVSVPTDVGMSSSFPFFAIEDTIPADAIAWTTRAQRIVVNVVREAGGEAIRHAPLFIASSSLNMGAIERGQAPLPDMHAEAEQIAAWLEWQGPVRWVSTACTSSINALIAASRMLRAGHCEEALVLGIELFNRYTLSGFAAMQLLSPTAALPLGTARDGLVLGEAVAALRLSKTPQRWALLGGACVVDGTDATGASRQAVASCWREALEASELHADSIDLLKLQAAGSPSNDAIELGAIDEVFAHTPALTSLKAHIGHTLGASGAAEIALLTGGLEAQVWPAVRYEQDVGLPHRLNVTAPSLATSSLATSTHSTHLLASIIGFGGSHACAVLQDKSINSDIPIPAVTPEPTLWEVCGRSGPALPSDWREALAALLGQRPRRIGVWAEAGLYGALQCMREVGEVAEARLPAGAILRISSLHGPMAAIAQTLQTIALDGMAMPFGFLQSQQGQLPAIIAQALQWQGDARIANHRDPLTLLRDACCEAGPQGMLIGWLEEERNGVMPTSRWLRLRPANAQALQPFRVAALADLPTCRYVRMGKGGLEVAAA